MYLNKRPRKHTFYVQVFNDDGQEIAWFEVDQSGSQTSVSSIRFDIRQVHLLSPISKSLGGLAYYIWSKHFQHKKLRNLMQETAARLSEGTQD